MSFQYYWCYVIYPFGLANINTIARIIWRWSCKVPNMLHVQLRLKVILLTFKHHGALTCILNAHMCIQVYLCHYGWIGHLCHYVSWVGLVFYVTMSLWLDWPFVSLCLLGWISHLCHYVAWFGLVSMSLCLFDWISHLCRYVSWVGLFFLWPYFSWVGVVIDATQLSG